jgi:large subunit ribosomal protein L5
MSATATPTPRLKTRYLEEIRPSLIGRFGYSSPMQAPRIEKIVLNMGVGDAKQDSKALGNAQDQLATIAGQRPNIRRARKSIAAFKLREGMPVGVSVTLRAERSYEFLDRLTSIAIPRIRDFRGLSPKSFDGRGNFSMGVREQIIFPEIDYDAIDQVRGLDITITTTAATDVEAFALLTALGMPFSTYGRPAGFNEAIGYVPEEDTRPGSKPAPPKAEAEPEPAAEAEPEPAAEAEPESAAEAEPEPAAEAEPEPAAEAEPESAVEAEPEPAAEAEPESAVEAEPEPAAEAEPESAVEAEPEPAAEADTTDSDSAETNTDEQEDEA